MPSQKLGADLPLGAGWQSRNKVRKLGLLFRITFQLRKAEFQAGPDEKIPAVWSPHREPERKREEFERAIGFESLVVE
ncbi:hypothetical protein J5N97_009064 [Dioscorea zingiberensis]|uniref:Uncharacterized protein n=1 Tax=Dioscorea zingiberensis TaxID=325984 RepID=A0A9D5HLB5_9LILI|nr:hypothetical protein J5N97_009064 [Dioscorea zingiberensis]